MATVTLESDFLVFKIAVQDEKVVLGKGGNIAGDHVEIWLTDPRIPGLVDRIVESNWEVMNALDPTEGDSASSGFCDIVGFKKETLDRLAQIEKSYRKYSPAFHGIFNLDTLLSFPDRKTPGIVFSYDPTRKGGYAFTARLPLDALFDIAEPDLDSLGIAVNIVDVDHPESKKQESMASSVMGFKASPQPSLDLLALPHRKLIRNPRLAAMKKLDTLAVYQPRDGKYNCKVPSLDAYSFPCGQDRSGYFGNWIAMDSLVKDLGQSKRVEFLSYQGRVAAIRKNAIDIFSFQDVVKSDGGWDVRPERLVEKSVKAYLLFSVEGVLHWPGGNGFCGNGDATDIVLAEFNLDKGTAKVTGENLTSCDRDSGREPPDDTAQYDTTRYFRVDVGGSEDEEGESQPAFTRLSFDSKHPELGIVSTRIKLKPTSVSP